SPANTCGPAVAGPAIGGGRVGAPPARTWRAAVLGRVATVRGGAPVGDRIGALPGVRTIRSGMPPGGVRRGTGGGSVLALIGLLLGRVGGSGTAGAASGGSSGASGAHAVLRIRASSSPSGRRGSISMA